MKEIEELEDRWEKESAWLDVILLSFIKPIIYDYPIPDGDGTSTHAINTIKELKKLEKIPNSICDILLDCLYSSRSEYSKLYYHLGNNDKFGNEWFYGYGTLYRWRNGEREKAQERINKHISKDNEKYVLILQNALKLDFEKVEPFGLNKIFKKL